MKLFDNFADRFRTKKQKINRRKNQFLYNEEFMDENARQNLFGQMTPELEKNIISDFNEVLYKKEKKEKEKEEKNKLFYYPTIDYDGFTDINGNPYLFWDLINQERKQQLKVNFNNNSKGLIQEFSKKIENFFTNAINFFKSKKKKKKDITTLIDLDKNKITEIIEKNKKVEKPKKMKYKLYEEKIGKTFHIIFYLLSYIIPIMLLTHYFILTKSYKEKYQSITEFNSEILNEIKTQEDIKKFDNDKLKDLALRVFKFADLGYEKRAKEKENIFPESFMN